MEIIRSITGTEMWGSCRKLWFYVYWSSRVQNSV